MLLWLLLLIAPVAVSQEQYTALGIPSAYYYDVLRHDALSNSSHSSIFLVANKFLIVPGILSLAANENACPSPLFILVGLCR